MRSGVLHAPLIDLAVTAPESALWGMRGRESRGSGGAVPPLTEPYVVIAGASGVGKSAVVGALIGEPGGLPVEVPTEGGADGAAWLVVRCGAQTAPPTAHAFVPGHREPRAVGAAGGRPAQTRPPRRVELTHAADLLHRVALVDTPSVGEVDPTAGEIVLDAAEHGAGLLFVTSAEAPLSRAQLDFLTATAERVERVAFVLTKIDVYDAWPDVLTADRALLGERDKRLGQAAWFPVALGDPTAVFGVAELRHLLSTWADASGTPPPPALGAVTAVTVSAGGRWEATLDREMKLRRAANAQQVSIDLATAHVRCVQELGSGGGCPAIPFVLDRALHSVSGRARRQLVADTAATIGSVFAELLDTEPNDVVLARIAAAARRTVDGLYGDDRERDKALLLTTTSAIATITGAAAVDSLAAIGRPEPPDRVLPGISVGLTASCYQLWQPKRAPGGPPRGAEKKDCRRWVQQALRAVEVEIERELDQRYADLRQALAIIAADAVDHGVLLA